MYKFTTVFLLLVVSFFGGVLSQKNCPLVQSLTNGTLCVCNSCPDCCVDENCECKCGKEGCKLCVSCTCHKK